MSATVDETSTAGPADEQETPDTPEDQAQEPDEEPGEEEEPARRRVRGKTVSVLTTGKPTAADLTKWRTAREQAISELRSATPGSIGLVAAEGPDGPVVIVLAARNDLTSTQRSHLHFAVEALRALFGGPPSTSFGEEEGRDLYGPPSTWTLPGEKKPKASSKPAAKPAEAEGAVFDQAVGAAESVPSAKTK